MRSYGRIVPTFWTRGSGRKLRGDRPAQLLAIYLFTCEHSTMTGLYYMPVMLMAHEVGLSEAETKIALARLVDLEICFYDPEEELIWVPEMLRYQAGKFDEEAQSVSVLLSPGDKRLVGVRRQLAPFAKHRFYAMFEARYGRALKLSEAPPRAPSISGSGSVAVSETETGSGSVSFSGFEKQTEAVVGYWQSMSYHASKPYATHRRRAAAVARLRDGFTVQQLKLAIRGAKFDDWFMGRTADSPGYKGLEHLFKDIERVERFIDLASQHSWTLASIAAEERREAAEAAETACQPKRERPALPPGVPQDAVSTPPAPRGTDDPPQAHPGANGTSEPAPGEVEAADPEWKLKLSNLLGITAKIGVPPDERSS